MKIKKLIVELNKILNENGNIPVYLSTDGGVLYTKLKSVDYFDDDTIYLGLTSDIDEKPADSGKE